MSAFPVVVFVVVIVRMIMNMIVVMMMVVIVAVIPGCRIGSTLGLERRVDHCNFGAELFEQRFDYRIAGDAQPPLQDLHRYVTVAEMPSETGERGKVGGARLDQRLGLGDDLDDVAVLEHQGVVSAKPHRLGQIEFDTGAPDSEQEALLNLTLRVGKDQSIDDSAAFAMGGR